MAKNYIYSNTESLEAFQAGTLNTGIDPTVVRLLWVLGHIFHME